MSRKFASIDGRTLTGNNCARFRNMLVCFGIGFKVSWYYLETEYIVHTGRKIKARKTNHLNDVGITLMTHKPYSIYLHFDIATQREIFQVFLSKAELKSYIKKYAKLKAFA